MQSIAVNIKSIWSASIKRQLMLGIALIHAVLMTIFIVDLVERQRTFLYEQGVSATVSLSETLAANSVSWLLANDVIGLEEVVQSQSGYPGLQYAMVLDVHGRVLGHTDRTYIGQYVSDDVSVTLVTAMRLPQVLVETKNLVDVAEPIIANGRHIGWARVGISWNDVNASLDIVTRDGIAYTLLAILVGILFAYFMAKGLTSSLQQLVNVADMVRRGVPAKRTKITRDDEVGALARAFNAMADTIQSRERDLEEARDGLEGTVLERTRELRNEITERQSIEEALKETEAKTRQIVNSAVDGIITINEKGIILSFNTAAERLFGYSVVEAVGNNVSMLMPDHIARHHDGYISQYVEGGESKVIGVGREVIGKRKDGSTFLMDLSVSDFRHRDSITFVGIIRDITERKEAEYQLNMALADLQKSEGELQRKEKRLREILDSSSSGISVVQLEPFERLYGNQRLLDLLGAESIEQLSAFGVENTYVTDEDYQHAFNYICETKEPGRFISRRKKVDGTVWWSMHDTSPIEFEGKPAVIIWHFDITDQKEAEENLIEAEKMASLGGLVAGVAHEINTPVGVGLTAATHLNDKAGVLARKFNEGQMKKSDFQAFLDTAQKSTGMISANLNRASELIRSFKQVAVDQTSEAKRRINFLAYIDEVLESLKPHLRRTNLQIAVSGDRDIDINTHPGALSQIITNLVMNSILHAFDKDQSGHIHISAQKNGASLTLQYSDDGKGMEEDVKTKIFEPFFTTKRGSGGSGLGMHILYNQVTQTLGGSIELYSKPGSGTAFDITIPYDMEGQNSGEQQ